MRLDFNAMIYSISAGLDAVEDEITGVNVQHGGHVAYLSIRLAQQLGYSEDRLYYLAAAAVMHDNAVTEYLAEERLKRFVINDNLKAFKSRHSNASYASILSSSLMRIFGLNSTLIGHCKNGEKNVRSLPFYKEIKNVILYHHENYNGTGPFKKSGDEIPFAAQVIHIADIADTYFTPETLSAESFEAFKVFIKKRSGESFSESLVTLFIDTITFEELQRLFNSDVFDLIREILPPHLIELTNDEIISFAGILAKITDYKSHFTSVHSFGIADKVYRLGKFYGYNDDLCTRLYLAGALHDIGKLKTPLAILEKPDRLTPDEFETMKDHVKYSYDMLKDFSGMEEEMSWAYLHHEKLDGSGYPFGKTADDLSKNHRLMTCVDIYQALTEARPYKDGLSHEVTMGILRDMANKGQIDAQIVEDINTCFA